MNADEITHLQFDTGASFTDGLLNIDKKPLWTCIDMISAEIEANMLINHIDIHNHFLTSILQPTKLADVCRQVFKLYREKLDVLNNCPESERLTPSALLVALQIVCVSRHQVLMRINECATTMETTLANKCQQFCASRGESMQPNHPIRSCAFAECTAKCINLQLKECEDSKETFNLYNEIAGAQMLMGIEAAFDGQSHQAHQLLRSQTIPLKCRTLIQKSLIASLETPKLEKSDNAANNDLPF
ncbi:unnamed protein product [Toxocara canis]|uniref:Uncharacterized protein n=1 Tax=Toxocara canis TaxID=6265 RepID=A0A183USW6_TOXCA|nr:unnamed protein product [Toxocara canis]